MHGEKWAWSVLGCTCKLITRGLGQSDKWVSDEQATDDARVEWRVKFRKNSKEDGTVHAVHVRCLAPRQRHHWIILKWVDYQRFRTTCDSSLRDSLICKNFIYAWPALITKGVCALNSPQWDARDVCQDWRVKTSRPLAQPRKSFNRRTTLPCVATQTWEHLSCKSARE